MGLAPDAFWSLTVREFWIKLRAFQRAEDRVRSVMFEYVLTRISDKQGSARRKVQAAINALRRYPIKPWLQPK